MMARRPLPVIMVSYLTHEGADATVRAMLGGAVDFVAKPGGAIVRDLTGLRDELIRKVRAAARSRPRLRPGTATPAAPTFGGRTTMPGRAGRLGPDQRAHQRPARGARARALPAAGGHRLVNRWPPGTTEVMSGLPADATTAYLLVQHMPAGMTSVLAKLLTIAPH